MTRIAFASSYPPSRSAVAMYTRNLTAAISVREIIAIYGEDEPRPSPIEVHHRIRRDEAEDYPRVARALTGRADLVAIQHEFDSWGGEDGSSVLDFVRALDMPAVATLHSVPGTPRRSQRAVISELARIASATVVMSRTAARVLGDVYGVDPGRIEVIPHGVPDLPFVDAETIKPAVGLAGRDVIMSFGLLRPGKGCELVLEALPAIVARHPKTMYVVLGATHPETARRDGEAYRESLAAMTAELGMTGHVTFVDKFVGRVELTRWLEAADVVLAPYRDLTLTAAGTVAYALAAGRAVVSTPFPYAIELLADGRGVVLASARARDLTRAVIGLLDDPEERTAIGRRGHEHSRPMSWWHTATAYHALFARVVASRTRSAPLAPRQVSLGG
jgi:glycosyltransferase involved in cell wall biosynthesis